MFKVLAAAFLMVCLFTGAAYANCTLAGTAVCDGTACAGETRPTGTIIFNTDYDVAQKCNADGSWIALGVIADPLSRGLVHHWRLDETTLTNGSTIIDSVGGANGTVTGTLSTSASPAGSGIQIDADNEYISFGTLAALQNKSQFTMTAWVKRTSAGNRVLLGAMTTADDSGAMYLGFWDDGATYWAIPNSGSGAYDEGSYYLNNTSWHHVALVYDGTLTGNANRLRAYLNGSPISLTFAGGAVIPATSDGGAYNFRIGRWSGGAVHHSRGSVDDVRIYNRPLSATEVADLYTSTGGT